MDPSGKASVYTYDGMTKVGRISGFPQIEKDADPETHYYGQCNTLPSGWKVLNAVYYLEGGIKTQERFFQHRLKTLSTLYSLAFPNPSLFGDITILFDDDTLKSIPSWKRHWLSNPDSKKTVEYIGVDEPLPSPQKSQTVILQSASKKRTKADAPVPHAAASNTASDDIEAFFGMNETNEDNSYKGGSIYSPSPSPIPSPIHEKPSSLPIYTLNCRCGIVNNTVIDSFGTEHGEVVQCSVCTDWSHIACQREGRADRLTGKFTCDTCGGKTVVILAKPKSQRVLTQYYKKVALSERLW